MQIEAVHGDITLERVDAVVNAANSSLLGGGGVDGAIHAAAGPELLAACRELRRTRYPDGLPVGDAVVTPGFRLPAAWVVHTVGPNRHRGETSPALLASCFARSLEAAVGVGASSIAFPAVSGGVYGWDMAEVARVAVTAVRAWAAGAGEPLDDGPRGGGPRDDGPQGDGPQGDGPRGDGPGGIGLVRFVLFSRDAQRTFQDALDARA